MAALSGCIHEMCGLVLASEALSQDPHDVHGEVRSLLNQGLETPGVHDSDLAVGPGDGGGAAWQIIQKRQFSKDAAGGNCLSDVAVDDDLDLTFKNGVHAVGSGSFDEDLLALSELANVFFSTQDV
jgi:hypothetical protein